MSQDISERLKSLTPKLKIYNASDRVQKVPFNSVVYSFKPGRGTEISGQDMPEKDAFGRNLEGGLVVANPHATAEIVADHVLREGRDLGLVLLRNDSTDKSEVEEGAKRFVKATSSAAKAIEARWLQRVLDAKAANQVPPPMPDYVEQAQDFLIKNKGGMTGTHKRFVSTLDGRSFNTKVEAKKHIIARYPGKANEFEKHIEDTNSLADGEVEVDVVTEVTEEAK